MQRPRPQCCTKRTARQQLQNRAESISLSYMHMNACLHNLIKENLIKEKLRDAPSPQRPRLLHRAYASHHSSTWSSQAGNKASSAPRGDGWWRRGREAWYRAALRGWAPSTSCHQYRERQCHRLYTRCSHTTPASTAVLDLTTKISTQL